MLTDRSGARVPPRHGAVIERGSHGASTMSRVSSPRLAHPLRARSLLFAGLSLLALGCQRIAGPLPLEVEAGDVIVIATATEGEEPEVLDASSFVARGSGPAAF